MATYTVDDAAVAQARRLIDSKQYVLDSDWGDAPLGGRLDRFVAGESHRMALDYALEDLAPSGALDYCFPPSTNRFFAVWTNPTGF